MRLTVECSTSKWIAERNPIKLHRPTSGLQRFKFVAKHLLVLHFVSKRILLIIINLNTMDVKIKDRKEEVEIFRMACNMAEIGIDYKHADLILRLQERLKKLKGKFSILDGVEIHHKWKQDWQNYFEEQYKTQDAS